MSEWANDDLQQKYYNDVLEKETKNHSGLGFGTGSLRIAGAKAATPLKGLYKGGISFVKAGAELASNPGTPSQSTTANANSSTAASSAKNRRKLDSDSSSEEEKAKPATLNLYREKPAEKPKAFNFSDDVQISTPFKKESKPAGPESMKIDKAGGESKSEDATPSKKDRKREEKKKRREEKERKKEEKDAKKDKERAVVDAPEVLLSSKKKEKTRKEKESESTQSHETPMGKGGKKGGEEEEKTSKKRKKERGEKQADRKGDEQSKASMSVEEPERERPAGEEGGRNKKRRKLEDKAAKRESSDDMAVQASAKKHKALDTPKRDRKAEKEQKLTPITESKNMLLNFDYHLNDDDAHVDTPSKFLTLPATRSDSPLAVQPLSTPLTRAKGGKLEPKSATQSKSSSKMKVNLSNASSAKLATTSASSTNLLPDKKPTSFASVFDASGWDATPPTSPSHVATMSALPLNTKTNRDAFEFEALLKSKEMLLNFEDSPVSKPSTPANNNVAAPVLSPTDAKGSNAKKAAGFQDKRKNRRQKIVISSVKPTPDATGAANGSAENISQGKYLLKMLELVEETNADLRKKIDEMTQQMAKNQKKIEKYQSKVQYNFL